MTKYLAEAKLNQHLQAMNTRFDDGKPLTAPALCALGWLEGTGQEIEVADVEGLQAESCRWSIREGSPAGLRDSSPSEAEHLDASISAGGKDGAERSGARCPGEMAAADGIGALDNSKELMVGETNRSLSQRLKSCS